MSKSVYGNHFAVGSSPDGTEIRILGLMPVIGKLPVIRSPGVPWPLSLTRENALVLAAWIVAVALPQGMEFQTILDHVRGIRSDTEA